MDLFEIILISIGLAMDAFAVSVCKGLSFKRISFKYMFIVGFYFGLFQGLMPMIGYFLGNIFESVIVQIDHWVAFVLLGVIGFNMLLESLKSDSDIWDDGVDFKTMLPLAVATSIDALTIGITFSFLKVNIFIAVLLIGFITFFISFLGVKIGNKFGNKYDKKAQFVGGLILILMGIKILFEHLGLI